MNAEFTPSKNTLTNVETFRHWCQKVLPLVYDDSLSYYELLCKVTNILNQTIENVRLVGEDMTNLHTAYVQLQGYVNNYFNNLDVQEEINVKLNGMAQDGSLSALLNPIFELFVKTTNESVNMLTNNITQQGTDIATLKSRMDSFSALDSGSTTGDAELIDGRTDFMGATHSNIGDAIRGVSQFNHLSACSLLENFIKRGGILETNFYHYFDENGVTVGGFSGVGYVLLKDNVFVNESESNNAYSIIARCYNGIVVVNGNGVLYYVDFTDISVQLLASLGATPKYTLFKYDNGVCIVGTKLYHYTASDINKMLSDMGVTDTVNYICLGFGTSVGNRTYKCYTENTGAYNDLILETLISDYITEPSVVEANCEYRFDDSGLYITGIGATHATALSYIILSNKVVHTKETTNANGLYHIIAKCNNGYVIINGLGPVYYITPDFSTIQLLTHLHNDREFSVYMTRAGVLVKGVYSVLFTIDNLNQLLVNMDVSDVVTELCVGIGTPLAANQFFNVNVKLPTTKNSEWYGTVGNFLGDSLTAQSYYTNALTSLFGISVNNYGSSGTTVSNRNATNTFGSRVNSMSDECDFVFVLGGTNDWGLSAPLGTLNDTTEDTFYGGLYVTLNALRTKYPTKPIFISTIPQRNWLQGGQVSGMVANGNGVSLQEFNKAIDYIGHLFGCYVVDGFGESGITTLNLATYTSDNLHFNTAGGNRFATFVHDCMNKVSKW